MATAAPAGRLSAHTIAGRTFRASARTAAHLEATIARLAVEHPKASLVIIQTCYHTGVAASAGTHDRDGVFDVGITGMDWTDAQRFLRESGWAAWYRHTGEWAAKNAWHIHMATIPPGLAGRPDAEQVGRAYKALGTVVGTYIDGGYTTAGRVTSTSQIVDYYAHAFGLAGEHGTDSDTSWFPANIAATVFAYPPEDPTVKLLNDVLKDLTAVCTQHGVSRIYAARALLWAGAAAATGGRKARINAARVPIRGMDDPK